MLKSRTAFFTCAAALVAIVTSSASADTHEDNTSVTIQPPVAEKREHTYTHHGITISDPYDWLYDKSYPEIDDEDVLDYVRAENAYFEAQMAPQADLTETLFTEMRGRIKEDDSTVPQRRGDYLYWSEFEEGAQYRKHYPVQQCAFGEVSRDQKDCGLLAAVMRSAVMWLAAKCPTFLESTQFYCLNVARVRNIDLLVFDSLICENVWIRQHIYGSAYCKELFTIVIKIL